MIGEFKGKKEPHMTYRENISIKTKYITIEDCRQNCVDIEGTRLFARSLTSKLFGVFQEDNTFLISSEAKVAFNYEFKGKIVEKTDGIYMEGRISQKNRSRYIVYISIIISFFIGIALLASMNPVFMLMGFMFMSVPPHHKIEKYIEEMAIPFALMGCMNVTVALYFSRTCFFLGTDESLYSGISSSLVRK